MERVFTTNLTDRTNDEAGTMKRKKFSEFREPAAVNGQESLVNGLDR